MSPSPPPTRPPIPVHVLCPCCSPVAGCEGDCWVDEAYLYQLAGAHGADNLRLVLIRQVEPVSITQIR
jgi:hypothetical protein